MPRQLKRRPSDGAAKIKRARLGGQMPEVQALGDAADWEMESRVRAKRPREHLGWRAVMKEQVLREGPVRFVEVGGRHARKRRKRERLGVQCVLQVFARPVMLEDYLDLPRPEHEHLSDLDFGSLGR